MEGVGLVDAARLASLASGRGGVPAPQEWPFVILLLTLLALLGTRVLTAVGMTRTEALLLSAVSPVLVLLDAPLGSLTPRVGLAANVTGCLLPLGIAIKIIIDRGLPIAEFAVLACVGILVAYASSHVDPSRGVLLQYRVPALTLGILAAVLLHRIPEHAGPAAFAAGAIGVIVGADAFHLPALAEGAASGRIVLGGAGLLDGILLVAILAAALAELIAFALRTAVRLWTPSRPTV